MNCSCLLPMLYMTDCAAERRPLARYLVYEGMAIVARMPMTATVIISSMSVKPRALFVPACLVMPACSSGFRQAGPYRSCAGAPAPPRRPAPPGGQVASPTIDAMHVSTPMRQALALAGQAVGLTGPNPRGGCVIVGADGAVLGHGHTQRAGGPHAEIMALRDAAAAGREVRGATAYVTLEPCSHHGRTGPCCDALVAAGIARVVASCTDPNPLVAGRGFERLRAAGVAVETGDGADATRELNLGFFSRMVRGTPWVRMKVAASLDGKTALDDGRSQWITGEAARADGHAWRARATAVLTGIGTVLQDDPRLDVRLAPAPRQPD